MLLSLAMSRLFPPGVRQRGLEYFRMGLVNIRGVQPNRIDAEIQGSYAYRVLLQRDTKAIRASCTCPYYVDSKSGCKHIWATILAAETAGFLDGWVPEGRSDGRPPASPQSPPSRRPLFPFIEDAGAFESRPRRGQWRPGKTIFYTIAPSTSPLGDSLVVSLQTQERRRDGSWARPKPLAPTQRSLDEIPERDDRRIISLLRGTRDPDAGYWERTPGSVFRISAEQCEPLARLMCATGRCRLESRGVAAELPLRWDDGEPYEFLLRVGDEPKGGCKITGWLVRGDERFDASRQLALCPGGLVFIGDRIARLRAREAGPWIRHLRSAGAVSVSKADRGRLVEELLRLPDLPPLELPEDLRFEDTIGIPHPRLWIGLPKPGSRAGHRLRAELAFEYADEVVQRDDPRPGIFSQEIRRFVRRDMAAERSAEDRLDRLGFTMRPAAYPEDRSHWELLPRRLPRVVRALVDDGWLVEAEGKLHVKASGCSFEVSSGIDWFDLQGVVRFGKTSVPLPKVLAALKRGQASMVLDDGTLGIVPEEWLERYQVLAELGTIEGERLKFTRSQAGFLDALLSSEPAVHWDESAAKAREELRQFESIAPARPPASFTGTLRPYQEDGLGWLAFLRQFGLGGCLADDMGLGKTVQVLALLETLRAGRKAAEEPAPPFLVVVPRSLLFNWQREAERFAPGLRVLEHAGSSRPKDGKELLGFDVVLTTYGTLRRDIAMLEAVQFEYAILDESQAIKNLQSETAKAARLLKAQHRLALSGTPVENHLGELWSLFQFLNPGMLGSAKFLGIEESGFRDPDEAKRRLLSQALRPVILRRTKEQVAPELPPKQEQVLYCELEEPQRAFYDELRDYFRSSLLEKVDEQGLQQMKIRILEALLRLRQAALHPGLLDKGRVGESSAKLDMLFPELEEVIEEGHKALVFSQFTSFLAIVRERLHGMGIVYQYLDGRTRDRQARVDAFQTDPDCRLFLLSLKAGGLGLNLTAADYVFILDPWWNPAVEAQAVDRTHRIGQTQRVFTYRLIARQTVEERIQELQKTKLDLVRSIITSDNSLIRTLTREDLEALLS